MTGVLSQRRAGRVALVGEGAKLGIVELDVAAAERVAASLRASGGEIFVAACDVADTVGARCPAQAVGGG